ncbi:flavin reductase family protein [Nocardioides bizhenqiangii]|uniref:Flavin reductase n=1 Tax=Nocardioides bizhenqiangii TaxID=3095076 RepID=A0ABZ0ZMR2_9ACTN|nr:MULTISPECIES: flavin reductase [unclassified Nocardioides]MDZ5620685.1 flavin reductase [Nocardioides sp. HM23]WQQ25051.1 flavin reductase [Nocardioides sp. HM61]
MTIHSSHPFADPEPDPARRLRGRLGTAVTLWTAGEGADRAGLTVTSLMVALGPTPSLLALLDPDSDLLAELRESRRAVVQLLTWEDRQLAESFAGTAPAPGGPFRQAEFATTPYGPLLAHATTHALVSLAAEREVGWSVEVEAVLDSITVGDSDDRPLLHRRGRFLALPE